MADWTFGLGDKKTNRSNAAGGKKQKTEGRWLINWAEKLNEWRESVPMSQSELAKKLEVSPMTVSRWVRAKARPIDEAAAKLQKLIAETEAKAAKVEAPAPQAPVQQPSAKNDNNTDLLAFLDGLTPGEQLAQLFISVGKVLEKAVSHKPASTKETVVVEKAAVQPAASTPAPAPAPAPAPSKSKQTKPKKAVTWPEAIDRLQTAEGWDEGRNRRLAEFLGVAPSTISNWTHGHRVPSGELKEKLAQLAKKHNISLPA